MKSIIIVVSAISLLGTMYAQDNPTPCTYVPPYHWHSTGSICWTYAMVRAYNKIASEAGLAICPSANTARGLPNSLDLNYFESVGLPYRKGYVVQFQYGQHYAYVANIAGDVQLTYDPSALILDEFTSEDGYEHLGTTVSEINRGPITATYSPRDIFKARVKNQLSDASSGGTVKTKSAGGIYQEHGSPYTMVELRWGSAIMMDAIVMHGTLHGIYYQLFKRWTASNSGNIGTSMEYSGHVTKVNPYVSDQDLDNFTAEFNKGYKTIFVNSFGGGQIKVGNTDYPSGHMEIIPQYQSAYAQAITDQTYNLVVYTFSHWSNSIDEELYYGAGQTLYPPDTITYTANFTAVKPLPPADVTAGGSVGSYVHLTWSMHPDAGVTQYQIWRRVKPPGGNQGDPQLMTTVGRTTTSWTDWDYVVTASYSDAMLNYDVRSYYQPNETYSDPDYWTGVAARLGDAKMNGENDEIFKTAPLPTEYGVTNYPNPFNPATTIMYQLVEDANVRLEIFDMSGKRIASLLNEYKKAGYHTTKWNGTNESGANVASGIYIYRFTAAPSTAQKVFTTTGKLILVR
jgi:hypothetical protein